MLKVFESFAGYGSQSLALERLGIPHQVVAISEIDKYAIQGYYSLHDTSIPNLGDISKIKVEDIPDHDLFTYSFPCQDISVAGRTRGIVAGETRSGLLYECEKIIEGKKPKYLLMENVKNLVGKKFRADFDKWLDYLEGLGYANYWKVLNAKHYGVPQNRERVFVVSILREHEPYEFPKPIVLTTRIKDILEPVVDEKYYINKPFKIVNKSHKVEKVLIPQATKKGYIEMDVPGIFDMTYPNSKTRRGRVQEKGQICPTLTAARQEILYIDEIKEDFKIRKLTPKECFRLMGLTDNDIEKIQATGLSDTQQYKMAGNSIVVDVLEAIFKNLF